MRDRIAAVVFVWNDGFRKLLANELSILTFIGQERLDPVRDHGTSS